MRQTIIISSNGEIVNQNNLSIINKYLATAAGRAKLAAAMVEPLRRSMDYRSVARKCISIQPLPLPEANKPIAFRHDIIVVSSRGKIGKHSFVTRSALDQAILLARKQIMDQEDTSMFNMPNEITWPE